MKAEKAYQILGMTLFGMLGSILIGFIFFNTSIFFSRNTNFTFIMAGLYGSLFFSLLEYKGIREQIFAMVIILFFNLVVFTGRYISLTYVLRDVLYLGSIFLSIKLYHRFIKSNPKIFLYIRAFALALFLGLTYAVFISLLFVISTGHHLPPLNFIYAMARNGILMGFGIGIGLDFYIQYEKHLHGILRIKIWQSH